VSAGVSVERLAIPKSLKPFFPEYTLEQLDVQRDAFTIIERTLRYGSRQELRWLFGVYPVEAIEQWLGLWGERSLPVTHCSFWRVLFTGWA